ncbi:S9 family peptidase [Planobacterium oryzisoli]|uniref:S9 family peptidase n=1 Tax=Planobacterium oryzisoli TaxID=2771435 RepID=A0A931E589_9FLAO|nr:S9 family peptidase [Planobacterium oryzisoli]MBF5026900.1 S9 family peptidase [Planobacterium oryzisoli]
MKPPVAKKIPHKVYAPFEEREDPYYWMNQRQDPEVLAHLEAENRYAQSVLCPTKQLQSELFEEMKARYRKDDDSLPYFFNGYWYIVRYEKGKEYPVFLRKKETLSAREELLLDANALAQGHSYLDVGSIAVSEDNRLLSYSFDTVGMRNFTVHFRDLETGQNLEDTLEDTSGKVVWAGDGKHVFYVTKDSALRAYRVLRHTLGTAKEQDTVVFEEPDETFDVHVYKSKSQKYIFISSSSSVSDEHHFLPSSDVHSPWRVLQPRTRDLEYAVEHFGDEFFIITNAQGATNFKLVKTPVETPGIEHWQEVVPHQEEVLLEGFELFDQYLVLEQRIKGLLEIKIIEFSTGDSHVIEFSDPCYTAYIGVNMEFSTTKLRYGYTSLTKPSSVYEYDMKTRSTMLLKRQEVLGDFTPDDYTSERLWATARDGKEVAISLVYRNSTPKSSETPLLLYGYGSYGHTVDASFSSVRLSLLDRGFVFAIAHVRGGEYLGRDWYEEGKLLKKKNTFYDFIDCAHHLIQEGRTSAAHVYAMGGSAGGLLVGAVANMEPQLFRGIVAQVPFVDVLTTMLDETIPLTTGEYDEWGDPRKKKYYEYIRSYSPYDNVVPQAYPSILVSTGFHDSQVQYFEPAKWVAKLREYSTSGNPILLVTDMESGHGGKSGRFESLHEEALEYAFLLNLEHNP